MSDPSQFDLLLAEASALSHAGHHEEALARVEQALVLARELADPAKIGRALDSKAWCLRMAGQWTAGGGVAQEAADHYAAIGDKVRQFDALLQVVSGYGHGGQHGLSVAAADRAIEVARELADASRIGQGLDTKAWALRMAGRWTEGGKVAQDAADHYAAIGDKVHEFDALAQVVSGYGHGGQHDLSVAAADRALALARELGDAGRIGQGLDTKAWALRMAGKWVEGGEVALEAADHYAAIGDKAHELESLLQAVSGFGHGGRHYQALSAAARAVMLAEELGDQEKIRRAIETRDWAIRMAGGDVSQLGFLQQAPIATLSRNDNQIDLFAVGLDGRVLSAYWNRHWFDFWFSIGESRFAQRTPIAALSRNPDQMDLFAVGLDGRIYNAWWNGNPWREWGNIGEARFGQRTPIAALSRHSDTMEIWAVRPDGRVEGNWWNGSWHVWFTVGEGVFGQRTPIAALSRNQDQMDLFAVGLDGRIYNAWWNGNPWREWGNIGEARFAQNTPIAALSRHSDTMEIWAVRPDGRVQGNWWNGSWHDWFTVGESVFREGTPIAALSRNQDQMDLFAVGLDGRIYNAWWNGNPWREWGNIGEARFAQNTPIGAISRHPDHMEIWAVGLDGQVYGNWWDGNWHEWFVVPPTLRLNFAMQRQLQGNWCWAATAVSVAAYYNPSTGWTQCSLADRQLDRGDCCTTGAGGPCNVPNSMSDALDEVDHLDDWIDNIISRELLKDHIVGGRPIVASIAWQGGGAHAVAITGYARGDLIEIDDPGPGAAADVDYDVFTTAYNGIGTWTHTYFTES